jgi:histidinol-phosphate aminotransferase
VNGLRPRPVLDGLVAYSVPRPSAPIDLYLDGNEGIAPPSSLLSSLADSSGELLRRYTKTGGLEAQIARRLGVEANRVIVTNGGDDALDRACRAMLEPGRNLVLPSPSFEMIWRYARLVGAEVRRPSWSGGQWPVDAVLDAACERTGCIAVVTPNNPTGAVVKPEMIRRVAEAIPWALIMVDLAYVEFADHDPTAALQELGNVAVFRTLSKAWGLAGLRVGYTVATPEVIGLLRAAGNPYPVSAASLALASAWFEQGVEQVGRFVTRVRGQRAVLTAQLARLGARPAPSQANFVFCRPPDAMALRDGLAQRGISIRVWPGHADLGDNARITVPGTPGEFDRLTHALEEVLS